MLNLCCIKAALMPHLCRINAAYMYTNAALSSRYKRKQKQKAFIYLQRIQGQKSSDSDQ